MHKIRSVRNVTGKTSPLTWRIEAMALTVRPWLERAVGVGASTWETGVLTSIKCPPPWAGATLKDGLKAEADAQEVGATLDVAVVKAGLRLEVSPCKAMGLRWMEA